MATLYRRHENHLDLIPAFAATTGSAPTATIRKLSNGRYWNHAGTTWQVAAVANPMVEYDVVNSPGHFALGALPLPTNAIIPNAKKTPVLSRALLATSIPVTNNRK